MTVMLVDDDSDDISFFNEAIAEIDKSIICLVAHNGLEALKILESDIAMPDHIFMDINMPLMDGVECLQKIRLNNNFKDVRITMYTTSHNLNDIHKCRELGADYIIKPSSYTTLLSVVAKTLTKPKL